MGCLRVCVGACEPRSMRPEEQSLLRPRSSRSASASECARGLSETPRVKEAPRGAGCTREPSLQSASAEEQPLKSASALASEVRSQPGPWQSQPTQAPSMPAQPLHPSRPPRSPGRDARREVRPARPA
ncbi:hypothetical protein T492DRAFT_1101276 [Pavlovales sp. CCMP2436]|nr:hypothetical protein T492DRAFT_1101276 [Pavlovales sp. CCMP2436]